MPNTMKTLCVIWCVSSSGEVPRNAQEYQCGQQRNFDRADDEDDSCGCVALPVVELVRIPDVGEEPVREVDQP